MGSKACRYIIPLENLKILLFTLPSAKQQYDSYFQLHGDVLKMLHMRPWPMCPCFVPSAQRLSHTPGGLLGPACHCSSFFCSESSIYFQSQEMTQTFSCNSALLHFVFSPQCHFIFQGSYLFLTSGISSLHPEDSSIICTAQKANARKSYKALILLSLSSVLCQFHDYFQV